MTASQNNSQIYCVSATHSPDSILIPVEVVYASPIKSFVVNRLIFVYTSVGKANGNVIGCPLDAVMLLIGRNINCAIMTLLFLILFTSNVTIVLVAE